MADDVKTQYEQAMNDEVQSLLDYNIQLNEEFANAEPDEDTARRTKKRVIELVPNAASQVRYLINHAESEAVRKDLSKWVLQVSMQYADSAAEHDEVRNLLKSITGLDEN